MGCQQPGLPFAESAPKPPVPKVADQLGQLAVEDTPTSQLDLLITEANWQQLSLSELIDHHNFVSPQFEPDQGQDYWQNLRNKSKQLNKDLAQLVEDRSIISIDQSGNQQAVDKVAVLRQLYLRGNQLLFGQQTKQLYQLLATVGHSQPRCLDDQLSPLALIAKNKARLDFINCLEADNPGTISVDQLFDSQTDNYQPAGQQLQASISNIKQLLNLSQSQVDGLDQAADKLTKIKSNSDLAAWLNSQQANAPSTELAATDYWPAIKLQLLEQLDQQRQQTNQRLSKLGYLERDYYHRPPRPSLSLEQRAQAVRASGNRLLLGRQLTDVETVRYHINRQDRSAGRQLKLEQIYPDLEPVIIAGLIKIEVGFRNFKPSSLDQARDKFSLVAKRVRDEINRNLPNSARFLAAFNQQLEAELASPAESDYCELSMEGILENITPNLQPHQTGCGCDGRGL